MTMFKTEVSGTNNSGGLFCDRYLIASHTTDYKNPVLFLNTIAVCWLVIAKFPNMHKVRIFGINSDYDT